MGALVLVLACTREREREPAKPSAEPHADPSPERPVLVTVELALVGDALREQLAARLDPSSPLVTAQALLAVHHRIAAPWHIYWENPGDSGLRTRLSFDAVGAVGLELGSVVYPGPDRFVAEGGQVSYGWEHDAVLFVPINLHARGTALSNELGPDARVQLRSDWVACHESCVIGHSEVAGEIAELERLDDPITRAMIERIPEPPGDRLRTRWTDATLHIEPVGEARLLGFFPYANEQAILEAVTLDETAFDLQWHFTVQPPAERRQGVVSLSLAGETRWLELALPWP